MLQQAVFYRSISSRQDYIIEKKTERALSSIAAVQLLLALGQPGDRPLGALVSMRLIAAFADCTMQPGSKNGKPTKSISEDPPPSIIDPVKAVNLLTLRNQPALGRLPLAWFCG
ncbi:hypothetical protein T4B_8752 [Trichinella pseudospiralis]|uniref:Uncharacterized protein n=1 Tax=Trichinella pseudospiralis TaxID=6337 RepID=A0A0V0YKM0_TRIPS|nr:hypothetical protein T4E_345 [Trichinella pseudospiralis]KRZ32563.1 hypothetical protein T4B_8752 [Trichinella pseudospiralis]